jgi:hypothetical protein
MAAKWPLIGSRLLSSNMSVISVIDGAVFEITGGGDGNR